MREPIWEMTDPYGFRLVCNTQNSEYELWKIVPFEKKWLP